MWLSYGLNLLAENITNGNAIKTTLAKCAVVVKVFSNPDIGADQNWLKVLQKEKLGKENALLVLAEIQRGLVTECFHQWCSGKC